MFSLSRDFNDVNAIDLKTMNHVNNLSIIDHTTRFSNAAVIKSRREDIVGTLIKTQTTIFGPPCTILSVNGENLITIRFVSKGNSLIFPFEPQQQSPLGPMGYSNDTMQY